MWGDAANIEDSSQRKEAGFGSSESEESGEAKTSKAGAKAGATHMLIEQMAMPQQSSYTSLRCSSE